jgi:hypothetical protein
MLKVKGRARSAMNMARQEPTVSFLRNRMPDRLEALPPKLCAAVDGKDQPSNPQIGGEGEVRRLAVVSGLLEGVGQLDQDRLRPGAAEE